MYVYANLRKLTSNVELRKIHLRLFVNIIICASISRYNLLR